MKNIFKKLFLICLILPCMFLIGGCEQSKEAVKIVDISRTSFDETTVTYTITYSDDSTFDFSLPNNDAVSIAGIEKTKSEKNVDTYTIKLTNDQTFDFSVTNGVSITGINYLSSTETQDCYEVSYSNGRADTIYLKKPEDKTLLSLQDIYETANQDGKYADILEFIDEYLTIETDTNSRALATSKAILSAVNVTACYTEGTGFNVSRGAGVIYQFDEASDSAYIVTNCHVVYNAPIFGTGEYADKVFCYVYGREGYPQNVTNEQNEVVLTGGEYGIECEIVGASIANDLAVLKAKKSDVIKNSPNARKVEICDSEKVVLSDDAIAIGNPQGFGMSVTAGTISVISEDISVKIDSTVATELREFRIDTAVNSGNSGGGLFNAKGQLIGIVNAKTLTESSSLQEGNIVEGMGYAIPSNAVVAVVDNMIRNYLTNDGFGVSKALLGVTVYIDSSIAVYDSENFVTRIVEDVKVHSVADGGVAEAIGFVVGDKINSIVVNDVEHKITRMYQMIELFYTFKTGDIVKFNCSLDGENKVYSCTIVAENFVTEK